MDSATDMAFSFMAAQIDRDTAKWETTRKKRAEAGRKGGIASGESRKQNEANATFAKQNEANEANEANESVDVSGQLLTKRDKSKKVC